MKIDKVSIGKVKMNPNNPRVIKDHKFGQLVRSIKEFPQMLEIRPIVVNSDMVVLGGNMRLKACKEAGLKQVPIIKAEDLTEDQQREFIIKDNVGFGEWDWEGLANEWDAQELEDWGLDLPKKTELNVDDLFGIDVPFYTPSENIPSVMELADTSKTNDLVNEIEQLDIEPALADVLKIRASFFTDFNFQAIADYYHHVSPDVREVFNKLGMVVLAPKEALKQGFVDILEYVLEE